MSNPYIPSAVHYQDLELLHFARETQKDPSQFSAYMNKNINAITKDVFGQKRAAFQKAAVDMNRYMSMDHHANFYKIRTGDVERLTGAISSGNTLLRQQIDHDKNLSKRQFEINDYYNYNKLEFLFFLQMFFVASLLMVIIIYLQKTSAITNALAGMLTILLVVIVGITGVYRYKYTKYTRDTRLWHRRYFGGASPPEKMAKCDPNGEISVDLNTVFPKGLTECADDAAGRFNNWQQSLQKEMSDYQEKGVMANRLSGDTSIGGAICNKLA